MRASVGRPGASAAAEYRRRHAGEPAAWTRTLPWRATIMLAAGVAAWLLAAQALPQLSVLAGLAVAVGLAWLLRFRARLTPWPGGVALLVSVARRACSPRWSAVVGRSCTTWPSPVRRPISIIWSSAPAGYW